MSRITWNNQLKAQIAANAANALDEIDLRIEAAAKDELYPGHGKLTGTLQRDIQARPARIEGNRVTGSVGTGAATRKYARRIHLLYHYIAHGLETVRPQVKVIISKHMKG